MVICSVFNLCHLFCRGRCAVFHFLALDRLHFYFPFASHLCRNRINSGLSALCTPSCHFTLILKFKLLLSGARKDPPLFSPLRRDHELFSVEETRLPSQTCCMYSAYSDACLSELLHGLCTLLARHIKAKLLKPFCQQLFIDLKKYSPANGYCLDCILPLKTRH